VSTCMTVRQPTRQSRMGDSEVVRLGKWLAAEKFAAVLTSTLQRRPEPVMRRGDEMHHERCVGQAHQERETA